MNATDMLVPPPPTEDAAAIDQRSELQRSLWTATEERMERFLPGFLAEIIAVPLPGPPPPMPLSVPPTPVPGSTYENEQQTQGVQGA
jgi:golgi-specific brefeldin A-resistance guanine nucleotide exchange factor 1